MTHKRPKCCTQGVTYFAKKKSVFERVQSQIQMKCLILYQREQTTIQLWTDLVSWRLWNVLLLVMEQLGKHHLLYHILLMTIQKIINRPFMIFIQVSSFNSFDKVTWCMFRTCLWIDVELDPYGKMVVAHDIYTTRGNAFRTEVNGGLVV